MVITYAGILFCPVSFKTIYFFLYCNLLVVLCELHLDDVHIGALPKFHRFTNREGDAPFGGIQDLCLMGWVFGLAVPGGCLCEMNN